MKKFKKKLFTALENKDSQAFLTMHAAIGLVTAISVAAIILETVEELSPYASIFLLLEWAATGIFTAEYLARLWVAKNRAGYALSIWGLIDLISILPTLLGLGNFTFLKTARLLRVMRLLRILRTAKVAQAYLKVAGKKKGESAQQKVTVIIYFFTLASAIIAFGALMYAIEHEYAPYRNIPLSMLEVSKLLIGGTGFEPPQTMLGTISSVVVKFTGLALFGLLLSVIGSSLKNWLFGRKFAKQVKR